MQAAPGDPEAARATTDHARAEAKSMGLRRPESRDIHRLGEVAEQSGKPDVTAGDLRTQGVART